MQQVHGWLASSHGGQILQHFDYKRALFTIRFNFADSEHSDCTWLPVL